MSAVKDPPGDVGIAGRSQHNTTASNFITSVFGNATNSHVVFFRALDEDGNVILEKFLDCENPVAQNFKEFANVLCEINSDCVIHLPLVTFATGIRATEGNVASANVLMVSMASRELEKFPQCLGEPSWRLTTEDKKYFLWLLSKSVTNIDDMERLRQASRMVAILMGGEMSAVQLSTLIPLTGTKIKQISDNKLDLNKVTRPLEFYLDMYGFSQPRICKFTIFINSHGPLTKTVQRDNDGHITTSMKGMYHGYAEVRSAASLFELKEVLSGLEKIEALCSGIHQNGRWVNEVSSVDEQANYPEAALKTKDSMEWPITLKLNLIDYDAHPNGTQVNSPEELIEILSKADPQWRKVGYVWGYSTTSGIYDEEGNLLKPLENFHLYVFADGPEVKLYFDTLFARLWALGYGYFKVSKSGCALPRSVFDNAVFPRSALFLRPVP